MRKKKLAWNLLVFIKYAHQTQPLIQIFLNVYLEIRYFLLQFLFQLKKCLDKIFIYIRNQIIIFKLKK